MADRVVGNLAIRLDFDGAKFEQGITKAKRELATYNKATQASTRIAKADNYEKGKSTVALNNMQVQYKGMQGTMQSYIDHNKKLVEQGKQNDGAFEKNEIAMRNLEVQMWELNEEYKTFQKEMYTANSTFTKMGGAMEKVGGTMQTFGRGVSEIGSGITKMGTLGAASLGLVAKVAMDFEEGLVQVQKTTNATSEEMAVFEGQIRGLANTMPLAVGELANVAALAGQLGIAQKDIAFFTETVSKLGTATNLSAEEAGNALARFQNITGTSIDTLENLGSAIVHLGNNFAAQESEIINLAMMLAGSMTTVGAAETDILGLSAAMSALGITAERGGSSMSKFFVDLASYVSSGSDKLNTFADVAGMSREAFVELFNQDSMAAVQAFITGLGEVGEEGGNMLAVLEDLDISEIRLRDTILRLANGHEVLGDALEYSKQGFEENVALTEEYELLAGSTASQVQIAKNRLHDLAITAGQELLPAIIELLNNSDGIMDTLKGAVNWFVNLDDGMKQNLVKWTAMSLVIGPVVSGLGNVISGLGGLITVGGSAMTALGKLEGALRANAAGGLVEATAASSTLAGGKGLGGVVTAITGSTGLLWALGLTAAALGGYAIWKTWGEEAYEAGERTKRWGTDVGESADSVLTDIENVTGKFGLMQQGINVDSGSMVSDFQKIGNAINDDLNSRLSITEEYLAGLPETLRKSQQEILQAYQDNLNEALEITENNSAEIEAVQKRASDENRELTRDELEYIRSLQNQSLSSYLSTLELSAEEEKAIRQALTGDIADTTKEQGKQMLALLSQQEKGMADARKKGIDETYAYLKENEISPESKLGKELLADTNRYHDALVVSNQRTMQELIAMYPELEKEVDLSTGRMIDRQNMTQQEYDEIITRNKILLDGWADSHRDVGKAADDANSYIVDVATQGAKAWNDVVLESGGNIDTFREKLIESTTEATAWNDIRLQLKNADLDSNAKLIIGEAAIANGWWDGMAWEDKQAVLEDNFSDVVYKAIQDEGSWAKLSWEEQTALLNNEFSDEVIQAIMDEGKWRRLPWEQKEAILTSNSPETMIQVLKDIGLWDNLNPNILKLLLDETPATKKIDSTTRKLDEYGDIKETATLEARDQTRSGVESARARINSLPASRTTTLTTRQVTSYESYDNRSGYQRLYARGTDNHPGGMAMVNDQQGSLYRELVTLPDGQSFIPKGRNVVLNLPEGSKVLRAALTKMKIPKYKNGIGSITNREIDRHSKSSNEGGTTVVTDFSRLEGLLAQILGSLNRPEPIIEVPVILNGNEIARTTRDPMDRELGRKNRDKNLSKGRV